MDFIIALIQAMRLTSNHSMRLLAKLPANFEPGDVPKVGRETFPKLAGRS